MSFFPGPQQTHTLQNLQLARRTTHLRMRTQAATREYARSVPMDIMSTRAFRSKRNAITAIGEKKEGYRREPVRKFQTADAKSEISDAKFFVLLPMISQVKLRKCVSY